MEKLLSLVVCSMPGNSIAVDNHAVCTRACRGLRCYVARLLWLAVHTLILPVTVQIVPVENIAGRKAVEGGDTCLRRTFSGVDLNRNWGTEWKQKVPCRISS